MSAQLDDITKKALTDFFKKKLGLFGALGFKREVESCTCKPCQTLRDILSGQLADESGDVK